MQFSNNYSRYLFTRPISNMSFRIKRRYSTENACNKLILSDDTLRKVSDLFLKSIEKGLSKEGHPTAAIKCYQTYVQDFPTGKESGTYLALDLGGTNFRVLLVTLHSNKNEPTVVKEKYIIPRDKKTGTSDELFDHIAICIKNFFMKKDVINSKKALPLAFTFSFPIEQINIKSGIIEKWTKGFKANDAIGKDVVQLLKEACIRQKIDSLIDIVAVLNDTTSTLISCAWKYPNTQISLIVGTGSNIAYKEKIENIKNFKGDPNKPYMVINCESGNFGSDGILSNLRTKYDYELDTQTTHKGEQIFEKLIAGRYIGEIMRLIMLKLVKDNALFDSKAIESLNRPFEFKSEYLTIIESGDDESYKNCEKILAEIKITNYTKQDLIDMRYISEVVSTRSAHLVAAVLSALLRKLNESSITIGCNGKLYRQHPKFSILLKKKIKCLIGDEINFDCVPCDDGSGKGAAITAAVICQS